MTLSPQEVSALVEELRIIAKAGEEYAWFLQNNPNAEPTEFLPAIRKWAEAVLPNVEAPRESADALTALVREREELREAAKHIADELEGLIPYLASHNWRIDRLANAVNRTRTALGGGE